MTRQLPEVQVKLTLHVAQETRHAWLWTYGRRTIELADGRVVRDVTAPSRPVLHLVSDADPA
jgi:hypothetical protein